MLRFYLTFVPVQYKLSICLVLEERKIKIRLDSLCNI
jgi:hypothetical protein